MKTMILATMLLICPCLGLRASTVDEGSRLMDQARYPEAIAVLEREAQERPGAPEVLLNLGWAYWHARRFDDAWKIGTTLVKLDSRNPAFVLFLANTEIERKDYPKALELAQKALKLSPDDKEASMVTARALFRLGREKEAMALLDKVLLRHPEFTNAMFRKAAFLAEMGRTEEALGYFERLVRSEPANSQYRRGRAKALYDLGRTEEAKKEWRSLARKEPDAESLLNLGWACWRDRDYAEARRIGQMLVKLDSRNAAFLSFLANTQAELGDYEEALRSARAALRLSPGDKDASLAQARALFRLRRESEAVEVIDKVLLEHPGDINAVYRKGGFLMEMGKKEEALACFDRAVRADPSNVQYRRSRARALSELGRLDEAKSEWRELATRDRDPQSLLDLGWAYWRDGESQEAWKIGSTLLKLDENNPSSLRLMANMELERMDYPEALRLSQKALRLVPGDRDASLMMARALFRLQRENEAIPILRRLIKQYPDSPAVQYHWGDCLMRIGQLDEALVYFERLVASFPDRDAYRMNRAYIWYELGQFDKAIAEWKRLVEREKPNLDAMRRLRGDAANRRLWDDAVAWQSRLCGLEPTNPENWETLAKFYTQQHKDKEALAASDKAVESDPLYHGGYNQMAEAYERLEDWPGAEKTYEAMLEHNRNNLRALEGLSYAKEAQDDMSGALRYVLKKQSSELPTVSPYTRIHEARLLMEQGKYEAARAILDGFSERKRPVVTVILYHGISSHERSDAIPQESFREQLRALKRAGYRTVTPGQLDRFFEGKGRLPEKPLWVTFDDARADAFQNADPVLKEVGFTATMFVHTSKMRKWHFHAGVEEIRKYQRTGRWDLQSHGYEAHDPMVLDPSGRKGHFLTNRRWVDSGNRAETAEEYRARIDNELKTAKQNIEEAYPGGRVVAFAFPFGDFGQQDFSNVPQAVALNRASVRKYYHMAVVQDNYGLNWQDSNPYDLRRYEVPRYITADQLVEHLAAADPWVQARMAEAELWVRADQPGRAQALYERLEAEGIRDPQLWVRKGIALEAMGDAYSARKLYAQADALVTASDSYGSQEPYDKILRKNELEYGPKVATEATGFSDSQDNSFAKLLLRAGAPVRAVRLEGWAGESHYSQQPPGETETTRFTGREAGLQLRAFPVSKLELSGSFGRLFLPSGIGTHSDTYSGGLAYQAFSQLRAGVRGGLGNVETATAIAHDRKYRSTGGFLGWDPALQWKATLEYDALRYNDSNRQDDLRLRLDRGLPQGFSAGVSFLRSDSKFQTPEYYTPQNLRQYAGSLGLRQSFGPRTTETGRRRGDIALRYEGGYGFQANGSRWVQAVEGTASWRMAEYLSLSLQAAYTRSPFYISRWVTTGLSMSY